MLLSVDLIKGFDCVEIISVLKSLYKDHYLTLYGLVTLYGDIDLGQH